MSVLLQALNLPWHSCYRPLTLIVASVNVYDVMFTKFHRNQSIRSKVTSGCRNKGGHLAPKFFFLMYNRSWLSVMYDKCHTLTVSDLQCTVRYCFWCPWKDQPNIFQPLHASFIHSRYIAFIRITVLQKSWKTDKGPGVYSKPGEVVRLPVWRYCHTPFQEHKLFVLLLVVLPRAFGKTPAGTGNFQFVQLHIQPLHTSWQRENIRADQTDNL